MPPVKLFGRFVECNVMHNNSMTSTSISTPVIPDESSKQIEIATEDAVEATNVATYELNRILRIWSQLNIHETAGHGSDFKANLASAAVFVSAAASSARAMEAVVKASLYVALYAKSAFDSLVISADAFSEEAGNNLIEMDSADVTRENKLNLMCEEVTLAKKYLSDALVSVASVEPNPPIPANLAQSGPSDFVEGLRVTSETLAKFTKVTEVVTTSIARYEEVRGSHDLMNAVPSKSQANNIKEVSLVEDDACSAMQAKLDSPNLEVDPGNEPKGKDVLKDIRNPQSVELESLRPCDTGDDKDSGTSMANQRSLPNEDIRIAFDVSKPINVPFLDLDSLIPESNSGHQVSKSMEFTRVSNIDTEGKGGPSYKAMTNRREYHCISTECLSSQNKLENKSLPETSCSLSAIRKRKLSLCIKDDVDRKERFPYSSETSYQNGVKDLACNTKRGKLVSDASERRKSSRKIQPTSRLLEGLETCSPEIGTRTQRRSHYSRGSTGSAGADEANSESN